MTGNQLYLAIGIPVVLNTAMLTLIVTLLIGHVDAKIDGLQNAVNTRLDDLRDLWRAELRRVEEVLDARLKHLEEEHG